MFVCLFVLQFFTHWDPLMQNRLALETLAINGYATSSNIEIQAFAVLFYDSLRFAQRVSISVYNIHRFDSLVEAKCVVCEVRTEVCMYCEFTVPFHVFTE